jgi:predicted Zn-dependent protease
MRQTPLFALAILAAVVAAPVAEPPPSSSLGAPPPSPSLSAPPRSPSLGAPAPTSKAPSLLDPRRPAITPTRTTSRQRLARVGKRIEAAVRQRYPDFARRGTRLRFGIIGDSSLNAMAMPSGRIYITSAFMQALAQRPDDELAAVLGHEATHVAQRHSAKQNDRALIGALLGALVGRAVGGSISSGARIGGSLSSASYSRDDEYRADSGSVELLATAGYDPYAMGRVLQMLQSHYGRGDAKKPIVGWFASHPDTAKRVENANRTAARYRRAAPPLLRPSRP